MNRKEIRAGIDDIISKVLGITVRWDETTTLQDLDADELDVVEISFQIGNKFGASCHIDDISDMTNMTTIGEIYHFIESRHCSGIKTPEVDGAFECYWLNSDVHKAAESNMTGIMDSALKEVSQKAWDACKKWMSVI